MSKQIENLVQSFKQMVHILCLFNSAFGLFFQLHLILLKM